MRGPGRDLYDCQDGTPAGGPSLAALQSTGRARNKAMFLVILQFSENTEAHLPGCCLIFNRNKNKKQEHFHRNLQFKKLENMTIKNAENRKRVSQSPTAKKFKIQPGNTPKLRIYPLVSSTVYLQLSLFSKDYPFKGTVSRDFLPVFFIKI